MSTAPFLDLATVVTALQAALVPATVDQVSEILDLERAEERRARALSRAVLVWSHESVASGPEGMGNGRQISETIAVAIQLRQAAPDAGRAAGQTLRTIRTALFDTLEGWRPDPAWAHLRYLGGYALEPGEDPAVLFRRVELYQTETAVPVRPRD